MLRDALKNNLLKLGMPADPVLNLKSIVRFRKAQLNQILSVTDFRTVAAFVAGWLR
jgi:hypothetical protein